LGERIALTDAPPGPWYVVRKDIAQNELVVAHSHPQSGNISSISLRDTNWFAKETEQIEAQYRYHGPRITGTLSEDSTTFTPTAPIT
ncbi:hypothetical protein ACSTKZ_25070, partial [Vibrio parahaemolyticus]